MWPNLNKKTLRQTRYGSTGESIGLHINNPLLGMPVPQDLNYWDRFKT